MFPEDFLEDPEERAKLVLRFRVAYLAWIIMVILSLTFLALYYLLR